MLGTIKLPKNMKLISGNLPESNYDSDRPKKQKKDPLNNNIRYGNDSVLDEILEDKEDEDQEIANQGL